MNNFLNAAYDETNKAIRTTATGAGGGAATIADGADIAEGATTDAVVAAGATGTVSAKLRRVTTDLDAVKTSAASVDGKLPATAALADATANPTLSSIAAFMMGWNGATWDRIRSIADNVDATASSSNGRIPTTARQYQFNGTSFDRVRNCVEGTLLSSSSRATTTNSTDQTNYNGRGVALTVNVTVEAATETLSLKIQGKDPVSSNYFDIVDFGVVYNATTDAPTITRTFFMSPGVLSADFVGITGNGSSGKAGILPRTWRAVVTHSSSGSWTYSVGYSVLM